jgi:dTDP-4-amino-4,6-dideoxygalactose transaminase
MVQAFEEKLARYCGAKYAVAMSSGTAALHAACLAAGIGPGDDVITTPVTFVATANAILYCGARPVFADIGSDGNIDHWSVERCANCATKAVIPVDLAGLPCEYKSLKDIAKNEGLVIIEDACHALGASFGNRKVGNIADMTVFSFHPVKVITTGEGGAVTTNNKKYYDRLKRIRHHGLERVGLFTQMIDMGFNYRITDFQCALGISQLDMIDSFIFRRREIANMYNRAFSDSPYFWRPTEYFNRIHSFHLYIIHIIPDRIPVGRNQILQALRAENIGVQLHYVPIYRHKFYRKMFFRKRRLWPGSEQYYNTAISLPIFPNMTDQDVSDVIHAVRKVVEVYGV